MLSYYSNDLIPTDIAPIIPRASFALSVCLDNGATAMLLAVHPLTFVDTTILPFEKALTLSLIVDKVALILLSIGPF